MSWHRTYRPKQIKQLHLTNVRESLLDFMKKGQLPQVMLFAGPKGTGKTSSARIIGAMLNDSSNEKMADHQFFGGNKPKKNSYHEPDEKSDYNRRIYAGSSFVVQELDAASNRGIDDVRELKERASIPPQDGKMTVYILDEAHMLTTQAFNALLKLLEEPPAHTVFILATTELHKIPETIKSRCSILHFRKASQDEIRAAIQSVLDAEKVEADDDALDLIAQRADGSFRDAVKMLEMVAADGQVSLEKVEQLLSSTVHQDVEDLLTAVLSKDEVAAAQIFTQLRERNVDESFFLSSLLEFLHHALLQCLEIEKGEPFAKQEICQFLLREFSQISPEAGYLPHLQLELKVLEVVQRAKGGGSSNPTKKRPSSVKKNEKKELDEVVSPSSAPEELSGDSAKLIENWSELLSAVKQRNITLEALLRSAKPVSAENGTARVQVFYKFHKEQLEHPKFKSMIRDCAAPLAGGQVKIEYLLATPPAKSELKDAEQIEDLAMLAEEVLI